MVDNTQQLVGLIAKIAAEIHSTNIDFDWNVQSMDNIITPIIIDTVINEGIGGGSGGTMNYNLLLNKPIVSVGGLPASGDTTVIYKLDNKLYNTDNGTTYQELGGNAGTSGTWGSITGSLNSQTDLKNALDAKQAILTTTQQNAVDSGITQTKVASYDLHVGNSSIHVTASWKANMDTHIADTIIHVTAQKKAEWDAKQGALTTTQLEAVNSGISSTLISNYNNHIANTGIHITASWKTSIDAHLTNSDIHVTTAKKAEWDGKLNVTDVINNLNSTSVSSALSANQGKVLRELVDAEQTRAEAIEASLLPKSDVVANFTTTTAGKALDATKGRELNDLVSSLTTNVNAHIQDITNPHSVSLSQAAQVQSATDVITSAEFYYGIKTNVNKFALVSDVQAAQMGLAEEGGPALAWGVDGVIVLKEQIKGAGATNPINAPYVAVVGDLVGDHAAGKTYEITAIDANGDCTFAEYIQPVADKPGLFYNIKHWYGVYDGAVINSNNARISCWEDTISQPPTLTWELIVFDNQIVDGTISTNKLGDGSVTLPKLAESTKLNFQRHNDFLGTVEVSLADLNGGSVQSWIDANLNYTINRTSPQQTTIKFKSDLPLTSTLNVIAVYGGIFELGLDFQEWAPQTLTLKEGVYSIRGGALPIITLNCLAATALLNSGTFNTVNTGFNGVCSIQDLSVVVGVVQGNGYVQNLIEPTTPYTISGNVQVFSKSINISKETYARRADAVLGTSVQNYNITSQADIDAIAKYNTYSQYNFYQTADIAEDLSIKGFIDADLIYYGQIATHALTGQLEVNNSKRVEIYNLVVSGETLFTAENGKIQDFTCETLYLNGGEVVLNKVTMSQDVWVSVNGTCILQGDTTITGTLFLEESTTLIISENWTGSYGTLDNMGAVIIDNRTDKTLETYRRRNDANVMTRGTLLQPQTTSDSLANRLKAQTPRNTGFYTFSQATVAQGTNRYVDTPFSDSYGGWCSVEVEALNNDPNFANVILSDSSNNKYAGVLNAAGLTWRKLSFDDNVISRNSLSGAVVLDATTLAGLTVQQWLDKYINNTYIDNALTIKCAGSTPLITISNCLRGKGLLTLDLNGLQGFTGGSSEIRNSCIEVANSVASIGSFILRGSQAGFNGTVGHEGSIEIGYDSTCSLSGANISIQTLSGNGKVYIQTNVPETFAFTTNNFTGLLEDLRTNNKLDTYVRRTGGQSYQTDMTFATAQSFINFFNTLNNKESKVIYTNSFETLFTHSTRPKGWVRVEVRRNGNQCLLFTQSIGGYESFEESKLQIIDITQPFVQLQWAKNVSDRDFVETIQFANYAALKAYIDTININQKKTIFTLWSTGVVWTHASKPDGWSIVEIIKYDANQILIISRDYQTISMEVYTAVIANYNNDNSGIVWQSTKTQYLQRPVQTPTQRVIPTIETNGTVSTVNEGNYYNYVKFSGGTPFLSQLLSAIGDRQQLAGFVNSATDATYGTNDFTSAVFPVVFTATRFEATQTGMGTLVDSGGNIWSFTFTATTLVLRYLTPTISANVPSSGGTYILANPSGVSYNENIRFNSIRSDASTSGYTKGATRGLKSTWTCLALGGPYGTVSGTDSVGYGPARAGSETWGRCQWSVGTTPAGDFWIGMTSGQADGLLLTRDGDLIWRGKRIISVPTGSSTITNSTPFLA